MNIEWKIVPQKYGSDVHAAYVGKIAVGRVSYAMRSKSDPSAYSWQLVLPGLKAEIAAGNKPTIEAAKLALEYAISLWFKVTVDLT